MGKTKIEYSATPAVARGISLEPLLGMVNLWPAIKSKTPPDHVIVGGESGLGARPMNPAWVRLIRDQCQKAGVPFFFKQWGAYRPRSGKGWRVRENLAMEVVDWDNLSTGEKTWVAYDQEGNPTVMQKVGKRAAGRILDGRTWDELPK